MEADVRNLVILATSALLLGAAAPAAFAQSDRAGRYTMKPVDGGGLIRLDTQTGAMSLCTPKDTQWSCREMAESGKELREDIDRLRVENRQLRDEVRRLKDLQPPGHEAKGPPERPGSRLQLPSEEDVDRAMTYLQRIFRKFREKLKEFEEEPQGGTQL